MPLFLYCEAMDELIIRDFRPADLPRLHDIRMRAFAPVFASFRSLAGRQIAEIAFAHAEADQGEWLDTICADGSGHHVIVAEYTGELVGFASYSAKPDRKMGELGLNASIRTTPAAASARASMSRLLIG